MLAGLALADSYKILQINDRQLIFSSCYASLLHWQEDKRPLESIIRGPLKILELVVFQLCESTAGLDSFSKVYQSLSFRPKNPFFAIGPRILSMARL